jgi:glucose-1-phosphate adenylyltransferase
MASGARDMVFSDPMREVGAIVLGGGRGARLFPLTALRAKPAVPLCGRYRLVDIPLSNCIHSGIKRVAVLTQFNSHSLNRHINQTYKFDAFSNGYVEVLAAEQTQASGDWFQGTADAVRKQLVHIRNMGTRYYVILSGDQLYRMDYRRLVETHINRGADITVAALPVNRRDAQGFGIMKVLSNCRIRQFVEKPTKKAELDALVTPEKVFGSFGLAAEGKPFLASMGVYVFNADVLEGLLFQHPEWIDFGKELIPGALRTHKVFAHMFRGFWEDIGTVRSYFEVSMAMTRPDSPFQFHDGNQLIYTHARALPGASIEDAQLKNTILCEGSRITRAKLSECIVGIRSIVHEGADIRESILLGAEYFEDGPPPAGKPAMGIGPNSRISRAIIDHNARIGRGVEIHGSEHLPDQDGEGYAIRDGIVIVLKNAVIKDGTRIG